MTDADVKPRYVHDCYKCEFLGVFKNYDLYYCGAEPVSGQTLIARYGPDGDYISGFESGRSGFHPILAVAYAMHVAAKEGW